MFNACPSRFLLTFVEAGQSFSCHVQLMLGRFKQGLQFITPNFQLLFLFQKYQAILSLEKAFLSRDEKKKKVYCSTYRLDLFTGGLVELPLQSFHFRLEMSNPVVLSHSSIYEHCRLLKIIVRKHKVTANEAFLDLQTLGQILG